MKIVIPDDYQDAVRAQGQRAPAARFLAAAAFAIFAGSLVGQAAAQAKAVVVARPFSEVAVYPLREASAATMSLNESRISAEVSARVVAMPADTAQVVDKGAVVARLDSRDYELAERRAAAALESSRARLALAEQQARRARELFARGFVSTDAMAQRDTEVAVIRAEVSLAETQLEQARRSVEKCVIVAPFRAVVRSRSAQVGELAAPGTPLLTLLDAERIEVAASVQLADVQSLAKAGQIVLQADGASYRLKLLRIAPAVARESRTQEARLAFAGAAALPGVEGRLAWRDPRAHVPGELLVRRNGALGVFVLRGERAEFVPAPLAQEGRPAPISLPAHARIVTEGRLALRHGQQVSSAKQ